MNKYFIGYIIVALALVAATVFLTLSGFWYMALACLVPLALMKYETTIEE